MQKSDLIAALKANTEEYTDAYYSATERAQWFDAALKDAVDRIPAIELRDLHGSTTDTAASITIPADFRRAVELTIGGVPSPIVTPDHPLNNSDRPNESLDLYGVLWGTTITLPSSALYVLKYIKNPTMISAQGDTDEPDIPAKYHYALVQFATFMALAKDHDRRDEYWQLYLSNFPGGEA